MRRRFLLLFLLCPYFSCAQSLHEKYEQLEQQKSAASHPLLDSLNQKMQNLYDQLKENRKQVEKLNLEEANPQTFLSLLEKSKQLRQELEERQREYLQESKKLQPFEQDALMHEREITLEQFITDYGSKEHLYIIPPEMAKMQLFLSSSILIPRSSWEEIIEVICLQNGIGIKTVNPLVKSLYWTLGSHTQALKHIITQRDQLEFLNPQELACFVLSLERSEKNELLSFLKKFSNERFLSIHTIGSELLLIGQSSELLKVSQLVEFVKTHQKEKTYRVLTLNEMTHEEAEHILKSSFQTHPQEGCPVTSLAINRHLLLLGSKQDLEKAEQLLGDIQSKICSPSQMTLYEYTTRYSDPQDLAALLQNVYQMMSCQPIDLNTPQEMPPKIESSAPCNLREGTIPPTCVIPNLVVNPKAAKPPSELSPKNTLPNFIVDQKTGMIIMVVQQSLLGKLKELVKKLDVPKKMVEIEVLLFEKKIVDQTQFGLNLLKLGDNVTSNAAKFDWNVNTQDRSAPGILNYFFSRKKPGGSFPPFNFAYNFLISQEDICIHSNPTITTVNQTQAVIDLVEEQSLNMGTVEDPRTSVITNTFVRAQYGIIIQITPTINLGNQDNDYQHYITLETDITFDTTTSDKNNRPDVSRRHIQNQVRIANNETLILGGLRRKNAETNVDKIPFIGDIPGLGRLFSFTTLDDQTTEMFILITPRIVEDAFQKKQIERTQKAQKRPGDTPMLLKKFIEAHQYQKERDLKKALERILTHEEL